ncbi:hypothetical protein DQ400_19535 [Vreelandella sulfidaeris]|uniref:TIR domain-containing protein n=1 Tax=Vreelandella sulfidaeris TaxID=115553 RepID=A0A365TI64_9GAMM|nr:toll/interleukin-1 receptor domain-containing protein [Halomonas sulfidaeris]RBI65082.1 hypothetical protein DQ400_19535 [Halomonas sulfidaeris]
MAVIYISADQEGAEIQSMIVKMLSENHQILKSNVEIGSEWKTNIKSTITKADVIVAIITERFMHSKWGESELNTVISYTKNNSKKLFIPIIIGEIDPPYYLRDIKSIYLEPREINAVDSVIEKIDRAIDAHLGKVIANDEIIAEKRVKFESSAAEYIEEALSELKERERRLNSKAQLWYWMGYGAIAAGVISAAILALVNLSSFGDSSRWDLITFTAFKSIFLVGLLLALAKYSFTLGKSYMDQSLKNSDRIHAISFGKFYLQAFGDRATPDEMKEVFQHWNISSDNSFSGLNSEMIEPKILEAAINLMNAAKSNGKKP